jgi:hypothetical protein
LGEIFDDDEGFGGVRVDAARRFANDPSFRSVGVIGEDGIVPIWRLDIDIVNDRVSTFGTGSTVGATYKSGIFDIGGAVVGVVNT